MASSIDSRVDAQAARKVLRMLAALRQSPAGSIIYHQVEHMLEDLMSRQEGLEQAYQGLVHTLLDALVRQTPAGSPLQVQLQLLQTRLQPPLSASDLQTLGNFLELYGDQIPGTQPMDSTALTEAVRPLLESFGIVRRAGAEVTDPGSAAGGAPVGASPVDGPLSDLINRGLGKTEFSDPADPADPVPGSSTDRDEPASSSAAGFDPGLTQQVFETITQNQEFGVLLEIVESELRSMRNSDDVEKIRGVLLREIEKLSRGHQDLAGKLDSTHKYLQVMESDSRQLSDELTRVRLLSLTDELTSLPNRRAFLRRLEDEVARVQRYGYPLSLALIDLDKFKEVNDQYGHAGGDEVLRVYARNILSIFRHHDLVARYGGEEFAVLLANTESEGALRALNKVRKRAAETRWHFDGAATPVPTFSAGLALYKPGETAANFIERADQALYRAKDLGRDRVEVDLTFTSPEDVPEPDDED